MRRRRGGGEGPDTSLSSMHAVCPEGSSYSGCVRLTSSLVLGFQGRLELLQGRLVDAVPASPIGRLSPQERAHGADVALVTQEVRLLLALGPELDGVRERVHGLAVSADEGAAEVDVLDLMLLGLQVGDLADVVTVSC